MTLLAFAAMIFGCNPSQPETPAPEPNKVEAPAAKQTPPAAEPAGDPNPLKNPALAKEKAPETFKARFETTKGAFVIEVKRSWAPVGADRFYNLIQAGYYQDVAFFRTVKGFMGQFGIHGDPEVNRAWRPATISDDPVVQSNTRGMVTFAKTNYPNSRTTQLFINFTDNTNLDGMGFAPFGKVVEGMDVVDSLHITGEGYPGGPGPNQSMIQQRGNEYLREAYPDIDYIKSVTVAD